ncbi:hypothetical protein [Rhizobium sp. CECT 9324]|uniref:hypothetical protein n=1 Tax=Rhizobium sp. CECT 9324 TaxID=2845820 RepID=UPI001E2F061F|nr:hypothetical protein [Rhizobium sp. CECT 9324]CAH0342390.1 hypothetical protein RHI9324_04113 [Rhizobium sp. CECT 9324]
MTNIKTRGFDSPAQMREYLEEVDVDEALIAGRLGSEDRSVKDALKELRSQIDALRRRIAEMQRQDVHAEAEMSGWLRAALTTTITIALGRIASHMKLGIVGAVAIPLVVAQLNRKL